MMDFTGIKGVLFDLDGTLYRQTPMRALMAAELAMLPLSGPRKAPRRLKALQAYRAAQERLRLVEAHLSDEMPDLVHRVLGVVLGVARPDRLANGLEEIEHHGIGRVDIDAPSGRRLDGAHDSPPKLASADASSGCTSRKLCAPVIVSIVSTRFCTPASLSEPPAAVVCR